MISILIFTVGAAVGTLVAHQYRQQKEHHASQLATEETQQPVIEPATPEETLTVADTPSVQESADSQESAETHQDTLESIWGIGPIYAKRLHAAGVNTFADLSALTIERIHEIVAPTPNSPRPKVEPWLEQAARLASLTVAS